jgi:hypothetical protein
MLQEQPLKLQQKYLLNNSSSIKKALHGNRVGLSFFHNDTGRL